MARHKSEDKRNAILTAATRVFAERGLEAATSTISKAAGVAEGTLFTYFSTKDDLINALYRELKLELGDTLLAGYPRRKSVKDRLLHVWNRQIEWGLGHPGAMHTLKRIEVWPGLSEASRIAAAAPFAEILALADAAEEAGLLRPNLPRDLIVDTEKALGEVTVEFIRRQPKRADQIRQLGFEMVWAAMTRQGVR